MAGILTADPSRTTTLIPTASVTSLPHLHLRSAQEAAKDAETYRRH
jgi:hypothetical protein